MGGCDGIGLWRSLENVGDNLTRSARRQVLFLPVVEIDQFGVIQTKLPQDSRLIVIRGHHVLDRLVPKLICGPVGHASSNSTSGKPGRKTLSVVVATNGLWVAMVLGHWKSTNLSPPVNQGGFQQSPLLEVFDQCGTWLVGSLTNGGQILLDMIVVVPWLAAQEELNKSNASLNQTTCDQTSFAVFFGSG